MSLPKLLRRDPALARRNVHLGGVPRLTVGQLSEEHDGIFDRGHAQLPTVVAQPDYFPWEHRWEHVPYITGTCVRVRSGQPCGTDSTKGCLKAHTGFEPVPPP